MLPDYPHKIFNDKRGRYFLLMEALAMDAFRRVFFPGGIDIDLLLLRWDRCLLIC